MNVEKFSDLFKIYGSYKSFIILLVAIASSVAASVGVLYILTMILLTGNRFLLGEPNILILLAEIGFMIVAVLLNAALFFMLAHGQLTGKYLKRKTKSNKKVGR